MLPADLIKTAHKLLASNVGKPRQSDLRRAVSTTYYAMFHALAKCCADLLVGGPGSKRSKAAWRQAYRALEHTAVKTACNNKKVLQTFPQSIQNFGNHFVQMQIKRHSADYDPEEKFFKSAVWIDVIITGIIIDAFNNAPIQDRRAFAAFVLLKNRT